MIDKLDSLRDCLYRVIENGIIELRGNDLEWLVDLATWAVNEIAALREARDALPGRDGADAAETARENPDELFRRLFFHQDAATDDAPAAPVRETPRLTRAQRGVNVGARLLQWRLLREALEYLERHAEGFDKEMWMYTYPDVLLDYLIDLDLADWDKDTQRWRITDAGRAALAAAQRGDAIRAPRGAQRSDGEAE